MRIQAKNLKKSLITLLLMAAVAVAVQQGEITTDAGDLMLNATGNQVFVPTIFNVSDGNPVCVSSDGNDKNMCVWHGDTNTIMDVNHGEFKLRVEGEDTNHFSFCYDTECDESGTLAGANNNIFYSRSNMRIASSSNVVGLYPDADTRGDDYGINIVNVSGTAAIRPQTTEVVDLGSSTLKFRNGWILNAWNVGDLFMWNSPSHLIREYEDADGWKTQQRISWSELTSAGLVEYTGTGYVLPEGVVIEDVQEYFTNKQDIEEVSPAKLKQENEELRADNDKLLDLLKVKNVITQLDIDGAGFKKIGKT